VSEVAIQIVLAALAGLLIGSFLNVCIHRLPRDLSVVRPRSFCPGCEKTIAWYDNVPVLSYVLLRGRCRHCGARIAPRYPIVELGTAAAFVLCVAALGLSLAALKYCLFSAILITLIASDLETWTLPDEFTLGGTAVGLVLSAIMPMPAGWAIILLPRSTPPMWTSVFESVLGAAFLSGMVWFLGWAFEKIRHREGMGLGDVKMLAMIGAFLGLQGALLTLITSTLLGSVVGLTYAAITRKNWRTLELPFGSFLGGAALAVAMVGQVAAVWFPRLGI